VKVAVLGGAGGIGQPLALLLKLNKRVTGLSLYDVAKSTPGVAADVGHIDYPGGVVGYTGEEGLVCSLEGAQVVLMAAGIGRKPGMSRDDLFATNAGIVRDLTQKIGEVCPKALVAIITNPVNSVVPVACEVLKKTCSFDSRKVVHPYNVNLLCLHSPMTWLGVHSIENFFLVKCPHEYRKHDHLLSLPI
jgi:malate dehydrogenase